MKLSELEEGSKLSLRIVTKDQKMQLNAVLKKHIRENIALVTLLCDTSKKLSFDNVRTDMEYCPEGDVPLIWYNVKVVNYRAEDYALQVFSEGVSSPAKVRNAPPGFPREVMVRDVSLTGFSISDRKGELALKSGDTISIFWEDFGHILDLTGRVVRTVEQEGVIIYGFEICNVCKDLPSYINKKQRQKR